MSFTAYRILFSILLGLFVAVNFISCSNFKNDVSLKTGANIHAKRITSGPWLMNSVVTTENTEIFDIYSDMDPREKDNSLIFKPDQTVFSDEGPTKYSENDPQVYVKGKWSISKDGKILQVIENGQLAELEVLELTPNSLKLRAIDVDPRTNTKMSLTISYNH